MYHTITTLYCAHNVLHVQDKLCPALAWHTSSYRCVTRSVQLLCDGWCVSVSRVRPVIGQSLSNNNKGLYVAPSLAGFVKRDTANGKAKSSGTHGFCTLTTALMLQYTLCAVCSTDSSLLWPLMVFGGHSTAACQTLNPRPHSARKGFETAHFQKWKQWTLFDLLLDIFPKELIKTILTFPKKSLTL